MALVLCGHHVGSGPVAWPRASPPRRAAATPMDFAGRQRTAILGYPVVDHTTSGSRTQVIRRRPHHSRDGAAVVSGGRARVKDPPAHRRRRDLPRPQQRDPPRRRRPGRTARRVDRRPPPPSHTPGPPPGADVRDLTPKTSAASARRLAIDRVAQSHVLLGRNSAARPGTHAASHHAGQDRGERQQRQRRPDEPHGATVPSAGTSSWRCEVYAAAVAIGGESRSYAIVRCSATSGDLRHADGAALLPRPPRRQSNLRTRQRCVSACRRLSAADQI